jgi:hypothetical protein
MKERYAELRWSGGSNGAVDALAIIDAARPR